MPTLILRRIDRSDASNVVERETDRRTPTGESEALLIAACQRGDRDAQRRLYDTYQAGIFRLVVRMVGAQDAADVAQQVFLQAFRHLDRFAGRAKFDTWLHRLALNECWQHFRRERRTKYVVLEREPMDHAPGPERNVNERDLLEQALARLEPELRAVFVLREMEGRRYNEIAQVLEINEGTVASRLSRARRLLRKYLIDLGWEP